MKKYISCLLGVVMSLNLTYSGFAVDNNINKDSIYIEYAGNGTFKQVPDNISSNYALPDENDLLIVKATRTSDDEILFLYNDKYVTEVENNVYLLVDKIELDIENEDESDEILNSYGISDEIQQNVKKAIYTQKELDNDDFGISLYVPSEIESRGASSSTSYYYDNDGNYFRDIIVKYTNSTTPMIEANGSSAKKTASKFYNFVLSTLGMASKTVSAFSTGMSAIEAFESINGPVEYGSNTDRLTTLVLYDKLEKQTDMKFGNSWQSPGCISYKVTLKRNDTYQIYESSGNSELTKTPLSTTYYSESFKNSASDTLNNFPTPYYNDGISIKIHSTRVVM